MLDNITVNESDLADVKFDIVTRYLADDVSYYDIIDKVKQDIYAEIKLKLGAVYPSDTNAELDSRMDDIKDLPNEKCLTRKISHLAVAKILEHNDLLQDAAYYRQLANDIPLNYYLDADSDATADADELQFHSNVMLGR